MAKLKPAEVKDSDSQHIALEVAGLSEGQKMEGE